MKWSGDKRVSRTSARMAAERRSRRGRRRRISADVCVPLTWMRDGSECVLVVMSVPDWFAEMFNERVDEIGNGISRRHHRGLDAELLSGLGGYRTDRRDNS